MSPLGLLLLCEGTHSYFLIVLCDPTHVRVCQLSHRAGGSELRAYGSEKLVEDATFEMKTLLKREFVGYNTSSWSESRARRTCRSDQD